MFGDLKDVDLIESEAYTNMVSQINSDSVLYCRGSGCSHSHEAKEEAVHRLYDQCVQNLPNQCSSMGIAAGQTGTRNSPSCYVCQEHIEYHCYINTGGGRGERVEVPCDAHGYGGTFGGGQWGVYINTRACGLGQR